MLGELAVETSGLPISPSHWHAVINKFGGSYLSSHDGGGEAGGLGELVHEPAHLAGALHGRQAQQKVSSTRASPFKRGPVVTPPLCSAAFACSDAEPGAPLAAALTVFMSGAGMSPWAPSTGRSACSACG